MVRDSSFVVWFRRTLYFIISSGCAWKEKKEQKKNQIEQTKWIKWNKFRFKIADAFLWHPSTTAPAVHYLCTRGLRLPYFVEWFSSTGEINTSFFCHSLWRYYGTFWSLLLYHSNVFAIPTKFDEQRIYFIFNILSYTTSFGVIDGEWSGKKGIPIDFMQLFVQLCTDRRHSCC